MHAIGCKIIWTENCTIKDEVYCRKNILHWKIPPKGEWR